MKAQAVLLQNGDRHGTFAEGTTFAATRLLHQLGVQLTCGSRRRATPWQPFEAKNRRWGFKDARGKVRLPAKYLRAEPFNRAGLAHVAGPEGLALIDKRGRVLLRPFNFDNGPDPFRDGLARLQKGDKFGLYRRDGHMVLPARYDFIRPMRGGRAAFCTGCKKERHGEYWTMVGGRWGYLDGSGRVAIPATYRVVANFADGQANVTTVAGTNLIIGDDGVKVWPIGPAKR